MFNFFKTFTWITLLLLCARPAFTQSPLALWFWTDQHRSHWNTQLKNVQALKKAHDLGHITGLEILIAEPSSTSPLESRFGHAFLRFVGSSGVQNVPSADLTVNFVANVHTQQLSARAGLVGEYAILPEVTALGTSLNRYLADEKRPLRRIVLPASAQMKKDLVETLFTWWEELKKARPHYLQKERQKAQERALKAHESTPRDQLLLVELPHPLRGVLGYAALNSKADSISPQQLTQLKNSGLDSKMRLDFLNRIAREKLIAKLSRKMRPDQILLQQGSYLHLLKRQAFEGKWVADGENIPGQHIVASPISGLPERLDQLLVLPLEQWRALELETHAIIPAYSEVRPPRVPVEELGRYTFLGKNCASTLISYLEKAELPARPGRPIIRRMPLKLDEFLQESLLAPYPEIRLDRLAQLRDEMSQVLGLEDLAVLSSTPLSTRQRRDFENFLQSSKAAAKALFYFVPELNDQDRTWLAPRARQNSLSFAQLHELHHIPQAAYELCQSNNCADQLEKTLEKTFGIQKWQEAKNKMQLHTRQPLSPRDYSRVGRRRHNRPHRVYYKRPEIVEHLHLLDFLGPRFPLDF